MKSLLRLLVYVFFFFPLGKNGNGILLAQNSQEIEHELLLDHTLRPFYHGVASGDPLTSKVIIWTRVTPDTGSTAPILVNWEIATDTGMTNIVNSGYVITNSSSDYTVKVDVMGLQPNTYYYYDFKALNKYSVRGRTKTAPVGNIDSLRFAMVSCADFEGGYFNAYKILTQRNDVDAIILNGDYIYEYGTGEYPETTNPVRPFEPLSEIIALADYRMRYSQYHLDNDLMRLHQQYPWMIVWDDHEFADNAWKNGAANHTISIEGSWGARKAAAMQAYFEWLPIREPDPVNDPTRIFRTLRFGDLCNFYLLDTRIYGRDQQDGTSNIDLSRNLLGSYQLNWLESKFVNNTSRWNIIVQQVMLAPLKMLGIPVNEDQWDGYPAERDRLYNFILDNDIKNVAVLTGDIHTSWANDLPTVNYNSQTGAGSVGVEFVAPAITSPSELTFGASVIMAANSHIKYVDLTEKGFVIVDINKLRTQADWYYTYIIQQPSNQYYYNDSWYVRNNESFLRHGISASIPRPSLVNSIKAPLKPRVENASGIIEKPKPIIILSAYPNPFNDYLQFQYYLEEPSTNLNIKIVDVDGRVFLSKAIEGQQQGLFQYKIELEPISSGIYFLQLDNGTAISTYKLIKI